MALIGIFVFFETRIHAYLGEDHKVCRFWGLNADSDDALLPGLRAWALTLQNQVYIDKKGNSANALHAVRGWGDDRCCRQSEPTKHPYVQIFPFLDRGPFKDGCHSIQEIVDTIENPDLKGVVSQQFGSIIRAPLEEDIQKVVQWLMFKRPPNKRITSAQEARTLAMSNFNHAIRTTGRPAAVIAVELLTLGRYFEDRRIAWEKSPGESELPAFRPPNMRNNKLSSWETVQNVVECARKGCLSDCFVIDEMYMDVSTGPKTDLISRIKKFESVKNESWHRIANLLVSEVSNIDMSLLEMCLHLRIFRYNMDIDIRMGKRKKNDNLPFWLLKERLEYSHGVLQGADAQLRAAHFPAPMDCTELQGF